MTVRETALELQCSISFVYKLMTQGQVAYECRGRRKLPVAESVAEYRQRNLVSATVREPKSPTTPYQFQCFFRNDRKSDLPICLDLQPEEIVVVSPMRGLLFLAALQMFPDLHASDGRRPDTDEAISISPCQVWKETGW